MLTIVVNSFDGYSDLWPNFFSVFKKYWPDCPYQVKLISNYKTFQGIDTITVGKETCWTERTLKALEKIETEYVLLLLEDYFFGDYVKTKDIDSAVEFLNHNNGKYLRLTNIPAPRFNSKEAIYSLYEDEEYAINLQASIWKKEFLICSLQKYVGNAWEFEVAFLKEAVSAQHQIMNGCFAMLHDPLHIHNAVLKGKWFPKEIRYFAQKGIAISWETRGKLTHAQELKYYLAVWAKNKLSYKMRKALKKILKKFGVKFVSDL